MAIFLTLLLSIPATIIAAMACGWMKWIWDTRHFLFWNCPVHKQPLVEEKRYFDCYWWEDIFAINDPPPPQWLWLKYPVLRKALMKKKKGVRYLQWCDIARTVHKNSGKLVSCRS